MKPSPTALQRYLRDPRLEQLPLAPDALFAREAPLKVEIGFGGGEYLSWWSGQEPDSNFFGIELPPDCIFRAAILLEQENRDHVQLVQGDARFLLDALFAPGSVDHVLMQFPMPWPKDRHAKHRVSSPGFATTLASVLKPHGYFELVTDQDWYATECHGYFQEHPAFEVRTLEEDPQRPFRTRYEQKWLEEGRHIHRLVVQLMHPQPSASRLEIQPMDHLHLPQAPDAAALQAMVGKSWKDGDRSGEVKALFSADNGWLLRAVASDEAFAQMFHLRIRKSDDERWLVQVDGLPRPYYTAAVRFLQHQVAATLTQVEA